MRRGAGGFGAGTLAVGVLALAAAFALLYLVVVLVDGDEAEGTVGVTVADLAEDPDRYSGRTVTVTNRIDDIVAKRAATLEADEDDDAVVAVANQQLRVTSAPPVREGDLVHVTGRVTVASADEVGEVVRRRAKAADGAPAIVDAVVMPASSRLPSGPALTADDLEREPREHRDELTAIEATVTESLGKRAWTVGEDLLAVSDLRAAGRLEEGETVRLTGVLRRASPRRIERDTGIALPRAVLRRDDRWILVVRGIDFTERAAMGADGEPVATTAP